MMRELDRNYSAEIDSIDKNSWYDVIRNFDDANIYQTWSHDSVKYGEKNIGHMLVKKNGHLVGAVQIRFYNIPVLNLRVGYIRWGPMWQLRGHAKDVEVFRQIIRAVHIEYGFKRGYFLRIYPPIYQDENIFSAILKEEGFIKNKYEVSDRTFIINLEDSIDEIFNGLGQKWRKALKRSQKENLVIKQGNNAELLSEAISIYNEMLKRKKFGGYLNTREYADIQNDIKDEFKMQIMLAYENNEKTAALMWSAMGNFGLPILAATGQNALNNGSSYLLHWKMLEWLKLNGYKYLDVGGINPEVNIGGYQFKKGLAGKKGQDVQFIGKYDSYLLNRPNKKIIHYLLNFRDIWKSRSYKKVKPQAKQES